MSAPLIEYSLNQIVVGLLRFHYNCQFDMLLWLLYRLDDVDPIQKSIKQMLSVLPL